MKTAAMHNRFGENPAYVAYESLLKRLHQLIRAGQGDSEAADQIRDAMEEPEVLAARIRERWHATRPPSPVPSPLRT